MITVRIVPGSGDDFTVSEDEGLIEVCAEVDDGTLATGITVTFTISTSELVPQSATGLFTLRLLLLL